MRTCLLAQVTFVLAVTSTVVVADLTDSPGAYDVSWNTIDSGGDASSAGAYQLTSTIGQPDADPVAMIGGVYSLRGGFWHGVLQTCQADINADNVVGIDDLVAVITNWGSTGGPGDATGDHIVNINDLVLVVTSWGNCPP